MKKTYVIRKEIGENTVYLKNTSIDKPFDPDSAYFKSMRKVTGKPKKERGGIMTAIYSPALEEALTFPNRKATEEYIQQHSAIKGAEAAEVSGK